MAEALHITVRAYSNLERNRSCFSVRTFIFLLCQLDDVEIIQLIAELRELAKEIEHETM